MINTHKSEAFKLQRIDLRTTSRIKDALSRAAEVIGLSVSSFLIEAAYEKAQNILKEQEMIKLSNEERDKFLILLEQKPQPTATLKMAMKKYLTQNK
jgi:uncharacterized protein (DUF1778 family)